MKSVFWANNRPTSTEDETATVSSYYPQSEAETEVSEPTRELTTNSLEDQIRNLELSKNWLKSENRMLEYKIIRFEEKMARMTTEIGAAEESIIQIENEFLNCKSTIDGLESDIRRLQIQKKKYQTESQEKQAQLETFQKKSNVLIKCRIFARLTEF